MGQEGAGWSLLCFVSIWADTTERYAIPVSAWDYLKMNCEKQILLKVAAFVLFLRLEMD